MLELKRQLHLFYDAVRRGINSDDPQECNQALRDIRALVLDKDTVDALKTLVEYIQFCARGKAAAFIPPRNALQRVDLYLAGFENDDV